MDVFFSGRCDILVAGTVNCELQASIRIIQISCRSFRLQNEVCTLGQLNRKRCSSLIIGNCLAIGCYLINDECASRNLTCIVSVSSECIVIRTAACHGHIAIDDLYFALLIVCWINITIRRHGVVLVIIGIKDTVVVCINNQLEGGTVQSNQLACTGIFLQDSCVVDLLVIGNRQLDRRLLVCPLGITVIVCGLICLNVNGLCLIGHLQIISSETIGCSRNKLHDCVVASSKLSGNSIAIQLFAVFIDFCSGCDNSKLMRRKDYILASSNYIAVCVNILSVLVVQSIPCLLHVSAIEGVQLGCQYCKELSTILRLIINF